MKQLPSRKKSWMPFTCRPFRVNKRLIYRHIQSSIILETRSISPTLSARCFWYPNASEMSASSCSNVCMVRRLRRMEMVFLGFSLPCLTMMIVRGLLWIGSKMFFVGLFEFFFDGRGIVWPAVGVVNDWRRRLFAWKRFVAIVAPCKVVTLERGILGRWRTLIRCGGWRSCSGWRTRAEKNGSVIRARDRVLSSSLLLMILSRDWSENEWILNDVFTFGHCFIHQRLLLWEWLRNSSSRKTCDRKRLDGSMNSFRLFS